MPIHPLLTALLVMDALVLILLTGAQVIAEGIETDRELRVLRELGVRYGQGFYFGAALRAQ